MKCLSYLLALPLAFGWAAVASAVDDVTTSAPAAAATQPPAAPASPAKPAASKKPPVLLTAKEVGYDAPNSTAVAIGHVEVVQGDTILLADRVSYDQDNDIVHATGHVSILEPSGDVLFSDDAVLHDQLEKGVIQQFRARLKDNSLFAAREGQRISKNVTKMKDATYSPCKVCTPEPGDLIQAPLWQMQAHTITVDENTQRVTYHNAFADVYGVPVVYTPYFSHPTPDAPSESGLLDPQYFHASDLGSVFKEPVYLSFAPNMDATITPWYMSGEKPLLEADFRHLMTDGSYEIHGAITDTYNRDSGGNIVPGDEVRGYIQAHALVHLSSNWDVGLDAERTTDDTFLQLYRFNWQDILTSRLYAERIEDRNYAVVESLAFQGLQAEDITSESPYILPQATVHMESDPLFMGHSRLAFDSSALVLERQAGDSDQRISSSVAWKLPYVTPGGQVFQTNVSLRADGYNVDDQTSAAGQTFTGTTGRVIPQVDINWKYPLIDRFGEGRSLTLSPVVELVESPDMHIPSNIPNEDSQVAELNDVNLFSPDRFTGIDQIESGLRGAYGVRGQLQFADQKYIEWLMGQALQENESSPFPIAGETGAHSSDYIGRIATRYKWADLSYSFRLDRETYAPVSNEVTTNFALNPLSFEVDYISLHDEPLFGSRKEVFGNTSLAVTPNWLWTVSARRDLGSSEEAPTNSALPVSATNPLEPTNGTVGLGTGIIFHNECMSITTSIGRSYISELDVKPSTTVSVLVVLKNFGGQDTGTHANNITGAGNITSVDSVTGPPYTGTGAVPNPATATGSVN